MQMHSLFYFEKKEKKYKKVLYFLSQSDIINQKCFTVEHTFGEGVV